MTVHGFTAGIDECELSFVVTRADGTVEDLGVVGYYNKSRRKRILHAIRKKLKELRT